MEIKVKINSKIGTHRLMMGTSKMGLLNGLWVNDMDDTSFILITDEINLGIQKDRIFDLEVLNQDDDWVTLAGWSRISESITISA